MLWSQFLLPPLPLVALRRYSKSDFIFLTKQTLKLCLVFRLSSVIFFFCGLKQVRVVFFRSGITRKEWQLLQNSPKREDSSDGSESSSAELATLLTTSAQSASIELCPKYINAKRVM